MQTTHERHRFLTVVSIVDQADFGKVLEETAFASQRAADEYGVSQRNAIRAKRIAAGEDDENFIEAIVYQTRQLELFDY